MRGGGSGEHAEEGCASTAATILVYVSLPSGLGLADGDTSHWFASIVDAEHQKGKVAYSTSLMTSAVDSCPFYTPFILCIPVFVSFSEVVTLISDMTPVCHRDCPLLEGWLQIPKGVMCHSYLLPFRCVPTLSRNSRPDVTPTSRLPGSLSLKRSARQYQSCPLDVKGYCTWSGLQPK